MFNFLDIDSANVFFKLQFWLFRKLIHFVASPKKSVLTKFIYVYDTCFTLVLPQ